MSALSIEIPESELSKREQLSIFNTFVKQQKEEFVDGLQVYIDEYLSRRKDMMDAFSYTCGDKVYKALFKELYNLSIKSVTTYFGARILPWGE